MARTVPADAGRGPGTSGGAGSGLALVLALLVAAGCDPNADTPLLAPTGRPPGPPGQGPAIVVDGRADDAYGAAVSVQAVMTQFGDASSGQPGTTNGSELDGAFAKVVDGVLYLCITGNLESNFNKLEIFFDTKSGGQNRLRADNPDVDGNGLNRMQGLTFDAGFEPDYWIMVTGGNTPYQLFANWAELLTNGAGQGGFLGQGGALTDGSLTGGTNPNGVLITIDNSNTAGVIGGCDAGAGGAGVRTGVELAIPLAAIGDPAGTIKISTMVNGQQHDFLSNQVLAPLTPAQCNLGNPSSVNYANFSGDQFFTVDIPAEAGRPVSRPGEGAR